MYYEGSTVVFLFNVIVKNGCISIIKDLSFYIIKYNCDECITKDVPLYYIEWNYHEWLYEYYKDLLLYYTEC